MRRAIHASFNEFMLHWLRNRQAAGQTLTYGEVCQENLAYALAIRPRIRKLESSSRDCRN
jgi:hypothetical protein